jgi:hypothetical protein
MKAHAGRSGDGSAPLCGGGTRVTSGYSVSFSRFMQLDADFQCKRCLAKAKVMAEKKKVSSQY